MTSTVPELASQRAAAGGDEVALVGARGQALTRAEWLRRAGALARGLAAYGVRTRDRVGLLFDGSSWLDYAVADLAVQMCAATPVGIPARLPARQRGSRLAQCGAAGVLHADGLALPRLDGAGWAATPRSLSAAGRGRDPGAGGHPDDLAEIIYTSGTTGRPKPVAVTHANLTFGRGALRSAMFARAGGVLAPVTVGSNAGHSALMLALTGGAPVHVLARTDPESVARAAARRRAGWVILSPAAAAYWAAGRLDGRFDLSCVTTVMLGAGPVPAATVHRLSRLLPQATMLIGYGSTESAPAFSHLAAGPWSGEPDPRFYQRPRSAPLGVPRDGVDAMVCDPNGDPLPDGELGEIHLRSAAPPRAYFRQPEATAAVFRDGWIRMGDLGRRDAAGQLEFFDRAADVVTTGGRRVSSLHVAGALLWHPEVLDAVAYPVPDPELGQAVAAAVELRSPVPGRELRAFLTEWLDPHELPVRIDDAGPLPRGLGGKHAKSRLRRTAPARRG